MVHAVPLVDVVTSLVLELMEFVGLVVLMEQLAVHKLLTLVVLILQDLDLMDMAASAVVAELRGHSAVGKLTMVAAAVVAEEEMAAAVD